MKSIIVFNQKGGVAKTSTTSNLMAQFTKLGKKVLGVDLDAQGSLTRFLGVDTTNENTLRELLLGEATFEQTVVTTRYGDLIPADIALQNEIYRFASMPAFVLQIKILLAEIASTNKYDYVLLDCSPSVNAVTTSGLVGADHILIPTEAEVFSANGLEEIHNTIKQVEIIKKQTGSSVDVLGILIVKYNAKRKLTRAVEGVIKPMARKAFDSSVFNSKIPFTVAVPASQAMMLAVSDYEPSSSASKAYQDLAEEILYKINEQKVAC